MRISGQMTIGKTHPTLSVAIEYCKWELCKSNIISWYIKNDIWFDKILMDWMEFGFFEFLNF